MLCFIQRCFRPVAQRKAHEVLPKNIYVKFITTREHRLNAKRLKVNPEVRPSRRQEAANHPRGLVLPEELGNRTRVCLAFCNAGEASRIPGLPTLSSPAAGHTWAHMSPSALATSLQPRSLTKPFLNPVFRKADCKVYAFTETRLLSFIAEHVSVVPATHSRMWSSTEHQAAE